MDTKALLLAYLKQDTDFAPYSNILSEVVDSLDIENYLLDKIYLDISYIVINSLIIDLDTIYFLCKGWFD